MTDEHRYTRIEYERRFVVSRSVDWRAHTEPHPRTVTDIYLRGTRLRLRVIDDPARGERTMKLTKKEASASPHFRTIGRILLTPSEYALFASLPGDLLTKVRHHVVHEGRRWAIDVFAGALDGLVLCEVETDSLADLMSIHAPSWAERDVTTDAFFDGANLARTSRADLLAKLDAFRAS